MPFIDALAIAAKIIGGWTIAACIAGPFIGRAFARMAGDHCDNIPASDGDR